MMLNKCDMSPQKRKMFMLMMERGCWVGLNWTVCGWAGGRLRCGVGRQLQLAS